MGEGQDTKQKDMTKVLSMDDFRSAMRNIQLYEGSYGDIDGWKKKDLIKGIKEMRELKDKSICGLYDKIDKLVEYKNLPWWKKLFKTK